MSERRTYRMIDGELVRIPDDKRDPHRRYKAVATLDGGYDVEFTDEEELQRDAEEAKWAAEAPMRETEQARLRAESERFKSSLKYDNRVVAFLDILGWERAISDSYTNSELAQKLGIILKIIQDLSKQTEWTTTSAGEEGWPGDPQLTHFSDSILISVTGDKNAEHNLVHFLLPLVSTLLHHGFLLRGGIALGPLFHRGSIAYGPALIKAYKLENDESFPQPRIRLDPELAQAWGRGISVSHPKDGLIGYIKNWREDNDGWFFYDFLQPFPNIPTGDPIPQNRIDSVFSPARNLIVSRLEEYKGATRVLEKYEWMKDYFNMALKDYPQSALQKIT